MLHVGFNLHPFYELGCTISLVALLMRNQIALRSLLLVCSVFFITNNIVGNPSIDTESAIWNSLNMIINIRVLAELIYGRTTFWFTAEDLILFERIDGLTPGEFRKLMRLSERKTASEEVMITVEGKIPDKIYFVYDGVTTILKAGREIPLLPQSFVGEIAFLNRGAASASVRVAPQTRWIEWPASALRRQLDRDKELRMVIMRLIGEDLARKVARA